MLNWKVISSMIQIILINDMFLILTIMFIVPIDHVSVEQDKSDTETPGEH
jgi:hypothetical protein